MNDITEAKNKSTKMVRGLFIGDGVTPTGFSTVNHNILDNLNLNKYDIHHLAVNYFGDPHSYKHKIYPAALPNQVIKGDLLGYGRLKDFVAMDFDFIYILNDIWVVSKYLEVIKQEWGKVNKAIPKIIVYYPVDGSGYDRAWYRNFDIVDKIVVYTEFGKRVTLAVYPEAESKLVIIPHGATDKKSFYPLDGTLEEIKTREFKVKPELADSFIVLNANRNQPRKRIDISLLGFALFAQDKPDNVMYYHHAGIKDVGWNIIELIKRIQTEIGINLEKRLILSNAEMKNQAVPMEHLNRIYNSTDVGINCSLGEGWGLIQTEHASLGKPQIVGDHSACSELFSDVGLLIPVVQTVRDIQTLTERCFVSAEGLAEQLNKLYNSPELYEELSQKSIEKFSQPYYDWANVAKMWEKLFDEVINA